MNPIVVTILVAGTVVLVVGVIVLAVRHERRTLAELLDALESRGFAVSSKPPKDLRPVLHEPFEPLELTGGAKNVQLAAHRTGADGLTVRLLKHQYTVHTGNSSQTVTVNAVQIDAPTQWPRIRLVQSHFGHKIIEKFGHNDLQLEDPDFNDTWRIDSEHNDFALLVLSQDIQAMLRTPPKHEAWCIGRASLICYRRTSAKIDDIDQMIDRVNQLRALIPPEVDAWA